MPRIALSLETIQERMNDDEDVIDCEVEEDDDDGGEGKDNLTHNRARERAGVPVL